jgi:trigger factor
MQISLENTGTFERKLTVTLPAARLDDAVRSRLQRLSREVRLKGFRPGKVPMSVIENRFGAQVREEAYGELVRDSFGEALQQEKLRPALAPRITPVGDGSNGELAFTAEFEVMPELDAIDVSGMKLERIESSVEDSDIDAMIDTLRQQRRTWTLAERAAVAGDMVLFEHSAVAGDARFPAEGVERAGTILGSGAMMEDFEAELVGMSADEQKTFAVDFPADWRNADLAGKKADVTVRIIRVQESLLPDVDAAFIQSFGIADGDMGHFRADVRANLERELANAIGGRLKNEVIGKLLEAHADLAVPAGMVQAEAQALHRDAERQFQQAQQSGRQLPPVPAPEAFTNNATQRVRAAVLIGAIAQQNKIQLDERRVREALSAIAATYEQPDQVIELYYGNQQLMAGLQQRVLEDQVAEWVATQAHAQVKTLGFAEVMKPQ